MQAREDINRGSLKQDWKTCSAGVNCLDIFGASVSQKTRSKVKCLRFMFRTRMTIMYICVQKFTSTHCGHTCHRALNYFFKLFFLQSGIIVQHTSSLTLKARTGNTSLNLFLTFSIPHRAKKVTTTSSLVKCPLAGCTLTRCFGWIFDNISWKNW